MDLQVFDVEHGACALLTTDNATRIMIDAGSTEEWRPGDYLASIKVSVLEQLIITNYDEDHVSGIGNLFDRVLVLNLMRNVSVSTSMIRELKSDDGMGAGIDRLISAADTSFVRPGPATPPPPFKDVTIQVFSNTPADFDDENNLSLVTHLTCNGVGVMFPGDIEKAGWLKLLENPGLRAALANTQIFVASHHGRESGCCDEVFSFCKPRFVVISDKGHMHDTQQTVGYYSPRAEGGLFRGYMRRVLTTRNDNGIGFSFGPTGWSVY